MSVSYSSVLDLSVSARQKALYEKAGLDVERWTEMGKWSPYHEGSKSHADIFNSSLTVLAVLGDCLNSFRSQR